MKKLSRKILIQMINNSKTDDHFYKISNNISKNFYQIVIVFNGLQFGNTLKNVDQKFFVVLT